MARPQKNNCDYFSHDNNMRNHVKVKAIRQKFPNGYAIWSMFLEYLTGADGNVFEYSVLNFELLSGDFGFDSEEIRGVIDYAVKLEMLNVDSETWTATFINSPSLDERLAYVYEKRGQAKDRSEKQKRISGKFAAETTDETVVTDTETPITVTETPQSKVNESKVNESKVNESKENKIKENIEKSDNPITHTSKFIIPTIDEIKAYCSERNNRVDVNRFYNYYESNGWMVGRNKMKDWKAAVRNWEASDNKSLKPAAYNNEREIKQF